MVFFILVIIELLRIILLFMNCNKFRRRVSIEKRRFFIKSQKDDVSMLNKGCMI